MAADKYHLLTKNISFCLFHISQVKLPALHRNMFIQGISLIGFRISYGITFLTILI